MSDVLGVRSCRAGPGDKPLTRGGSRLEKAAVVGVVGPPRSFSFDVVPSRLVADQLALKEGDCPGLSGWGP